MTKNKFIINEIIQKFDTIDNVYIKLGGISGNINEYNKDILDEECTIIIPKSSLNNFYNQFNEALNQDIKKNINSDKKENIKKEEEWFGAPLNFKK